MLLPNINPILEKLTIEQYSCSIKENDIIYLKENWYLENPFISNKFSKKKIMADLEAVLADVSYLMAMEKSKSTPAASASKKIVLPDRT